MCAKKALFIRINLLAVVDGNLRAITAAVNSYTNERQLLQYEKQIYSLKRDCGSNVPMRSDFSDQYDKDECDVTEASDSELWEDVTC